MSANTDQSSMEQPNFTRLLFKSLLDLNKKQLNKSKYEQEKQQKINEILRERMKLIQMNLNKNPEYWGVSREAKAAELPAFKSKLLKTICDEVEIEEQVIRDGVLVSEINEFEKEQYKRKRYPILGTPNGPQYADDTVDEMNYNTANKSYIFTEELVEDIYDDEEVECKPEQYHLRDVMDTLQSYHPYDPEFYDIDARPPDFQLVKPCNPDQWNLEPILRDIHAKIIDDPAGLQKLFECGPYSTDSTGKTICYEYVIGRCPKNYNCGYSHSVPLELTPTQELVREAHTYHPTVSTTAIFDRVTAYKNAALTVPLLHIYPDNIHAIRECEAWEGSSTSPSPSEYEEYSKNEQLKDFANAEHSSPYIANTPDSLPSLPASLPSPREISTISSSATKPSVSTISSSPQQTPKVTNANLQQLASIELNQMKGETAFNETTIVFYYVDQADNDDDYDDDSTTPAPPASSPPPPKLYRKNDVSTQKHFNLQQQMPFSSMIYTSKLASQSTLKAIIPSPNIIRGDMTEEVEQEEKSEMN